MGVQLDSGLWPRVPRSAPSNTPLSGITRSLARFARSINVYRSPRTLQTSFTTD